MTRYSMTSKSAICLAIITSAIELGAAGCYYPAKIQPPSAAKTQTLVNVPYDLTWDAVHTVVNQNEYKVLGDDPNNGIVEAEAHSFTLADADCGQIKSVAIDTTPSRMRAAVRFTISRSNLRAVKPPT